MGRSLLKAGSVWTALSVATFVLGGAIAHGQASRPPSGAPQSNTQKPPSMMVNEGQASAMVAQRQQMMAAMRTLDRSSTRWSPNECRAWDRKSDAIAAVVKEMVAERTQMRAQMMTMDDRMMGHMMQH